jgi:hypothetical protein
MAHAFRPAPSRSFPRILLGALACALLAGGTAQAGSLSMASHMQSVAQVEFDPESAHLPSIQIEPIRSSIPLNDRIDADTVFDAPFSQALRDGLAWYLAARGVRVVEDRGDVRVAVAIESYEGWRRPGRWGASVTLRTRLYHDSRVVVTASVQSMLRYPYPGAVLDAGSGGQAPERTASPSEMLFTRIGLELATKIHALLKKDAPVAAPPVAMSPDPGVTLVRRTLERGVITIEASVDHAEVFLDGQMVGTTPLIDLNLAAGPHVLEVRRPGYQTWKRQIHVIERAASRFYAEMTEAPAAGTEGS